MNAPVIVDRRRVLAGSGALIVRFSLPGAFAQDRAASAAAPAPSRPGSLNTSPYLDSWIRIDADSAITVFTGKAELGQGFKTAFQQIAAEELDVPFGSLKVVTADTKSDLNLGTQAGLSVVDKGADVMLVTLDHQVASTQIDADADQRLEVLDVFVIGAEKRPYTFLG